MVGDRSRSIYRFSEHIRRMRTHLYLLLLAAGISAASQMSSMAELLTLSQQMWRSVAKDLPNLRIETPDNVDNASPIPSCVKALYELTLSNLHFQQTLLTRLFFLLYLNWELGFKDVNCVSAIFEGTEQLKTNPAMKEFSVFFQKFEILKQSFTPRLPKEGKCDTERKNAARFLEKVMTFIRKASKTARA